MVTENQIKMEEETNQLNKLSVLSLIVAIVGLVIGLYNQIVNIPNINKVIDNSTGEFKNDVVFISMKTGIIVILIGFISILLAIFPVKRKSTLGYIALILGIIVTFLGLYQGLSI